MQSLSSRVIAITMVAFVLVAVVRAWSDNGTQAPSAAPSSPTASTIALEWYSINGGGTAAAASTNYQVGLSVGQSVAGSAVGSQYQVGLGFWYGFAAGAGACLIAVAGDVNESGSITPADIIALVNFVFKGGNPPDPCEANGDVNCNGSVTSADIIFEVNFVFKGGDPPCDICNDSALPCI